MVLATSGIRRVPEEADESRRVRAGEADRFLSLLGGSMLALYGLSRRGLPGLIAAGAGALLLHRAATGRSPALLALGIRTGTGEGGPRGRLASLEASRAVKVERTVTVARPREELFAFWRALENLPRVMAHLESVEWVDATRSRWRAKGPGGTHVEWHAVIHNEVPNELLAWRSVEPSDIRNAGTVLFRDAPANGGTEVKVILEYEPPAGLVGRRVARLFGEEPDQQVREDLRRFKRLMEAGELA